MVIVCSIYLTKTSEKGLMKSSPSSVVRICSIYGTWFIRGQSKILKRGLDKNHMKAGSSNMILVYSIY